MDSSPDNFEALEKLLRLKRHEQPPPRYFNDFSRRIIERIEAGEARTSWWDRFGLDLRPAFAAGAGVVACGLVIYGVAKSGPNDLSDVGLSPSGGLANVSPMKELLATRESIDVNSTNPITSSGTSPERKGFPVPVVPASMQLR